MKRSVNSLRTQKGGFTIIEVLVFLGISSLVFMSAVIYMSGRQAHQQFQSTVREFEATLSDIANDVATGYYQNGSPLKCDALGSPKTPTFSSISQELGTNSGCIFVGTAVKFGNGAPSAGAEKFVQFTMAGVRQNSSGVGVTSLAEANPRVVDVAGSYATNTIGSGVTVKCVRVGDSSQPCLESNNAAVGFFTTFDGSDMNSTSGSTIRTTTLAFNDVSVNDVVSGSGGTIGKINAANYASATLNPGITVCLLGNASNQYALVKIGGNGSSNTTVTSEIKSGSSCV